MKSSLPRQRIDFLPVREGVSGCGLCSPLSAIVAQLCNSLTHSAEGSIACGVVHCCSEAIFLLSFLLKKDYLHTCFTFVGPKNNFGHNRRGTRRRLFLLIATPSCKVHRTRNRGHVCTMQSWLMKTKATNIGDGVFRRCMRRKAINLAGC